MDRLLLLLALAVLMTVMPVKLAVGLDDGLALTPTMAWTSWNLCRFEVNATGAMKILLILETSQFIVSFLT